MKKFLMNLRTLAYGLMLVSLVMVITNSCEDVDMPTLSENSVAPPVVSPTAPSFNIEGFKSAMAETSIITERGAEMILSANNNGLPLNSWTWNIIDGSNVFDQIAGQKINFTFYSLPDTPCSIELVGVDSTNASQPAMSVIVNVNTVFNFDMTEMLVFRTSYYSGGGNYRVDFCVSKNLTKFVPSGGLPGTYWLSGSMNNWTPTSLAVADSNVNLSSDKQIVIPPAGEMGKYYLIKMYLAPGQVYSFNTGKRNNDGEYVYTNFVGEPISQWVNPSDKAMVKFELTTSGVYSVGGGGSTGNLPGEIGDSDASYSVVRLDFYSTYFRLYLNNFSNMTATKYAQQRNSDFSWQAVELQSAVANYPTWGSVDINYSEGQNGALFCFRYGNNSAQPGTYNSNSSYSIYWDGWNEHLSFILKDIGILTMVDNGDDVFDENDFSLVYQKHLFMLEAGQTLEVFTY